MAVSEMVLIPGPAGSLELAVDLGEIKKNSKIKPHGFHDRFVVVVAHPHPLYGGAMDNKVVTTLSGLYREYGYDVVRFNFRGVGASEGAHDEGRGEVDDMVAVAKYALAQRPDAQLILAGFSFGAAIAAAASEILSCQHMVLIAPPVDRYSFAPSGEFTCPTGIVVGGRDDIVDADLIATWAGEMTNPPQLVSIPEASHFFHGELVALKEKLRPLVHAMMAGKE